VAEDTLVKEQLTPDMIAAGGELTKRIQADKDSRCLAGKRSI
jgi:hypothetical protein